MASRLLGALACALIFLLGAPGCATYMLQASLLGHVGDDPTRAIRPVAAEVDEARDGTVTLRITMRLDDASADGVDPGTAWDYIVTIPRTGTAQVADAGEHAGAVHEDTAEPPLLLPTATAAARAKAPPPANAPRVIALDGAPPFMPATDPVSVLAKDGVSRRRLERAQLSRAVLVVQDNPDLACNPDLPEDARAQAALVRAEAEESDYLLTVYLPPPSGHRIEARPSYEGGPTSDQLLIGAPRAVVRLPHADWPGRRRKARAGDVGSIALFALCVPVAVAFDIVTSPFQLALYCLLSSAFKGGRVC